MNKTQHCGVIFLENGWFCVYVVIGFYVIIWIINLVGNIKDKKEKDTKVKERDQESGRFLVRWITPKGKYRGAIKLSEDNFEIHEFGHMFTSGYGKNYEWDCFKKVIIRQDGNQGQLRNILEIEITSEGVASNLILQAESLDDAKRILSIIDKIKTMRRRKLDYEKFLRSRYKIGNLDGITPNQFEKLIQELFTSMGYDVTHTGHTGDQGIDLICRKDSNDDVVIVQCKRYKGKVGVGAVREFHSALLQRKAVKGYIVTTSDFTSGAYAWTIGKPIELINGKHLTNLLIKYYVP